MNEHPPIERGTPGRDSNWWWCNRCDGHHKARPHRDLDTIDIEHDMGLRDLTDPFTGEYEW
jgi:hypothetical protein